MKKLNYQPNMYASALASNKKYRFCLSAPSHNEGDYWKDVERGMQQAITRFSDFNVSLSDYYYDQYESGAFIESGMRILEAQPDGVILSPTVEEETERFVSLLREAGFRMYLLIRILPGWSRWLSTDSMPSGRIFCRRPRCCACWLVANRKLVIFRQINEGRLRFQNQQLHREEGFYEYMKEHCPELKMWELNLCPNSRVKMLRCWTISFAAHPNVKCGITFNSKAYIIGEYMQRHGRTDFHLMGYDLLRRNVACLKEGVIDFIIAQQPTVQGYNSIECLCNHLILRKKVKDCNYMPINLITTENIDFYFDAHVNE